MAPEILSRVLHGHITPSRRPQLAQQQLHIQPAVLHGYSRHKVAGADYPGIIPSTVGTGKSVRGTYVRGLSAGDVERLDVFEGGEYERVVVRCVVLVPRVGGDGGVELVEGEEVVAETYVFTAGEGGLEAEEWDYETFRREKLRNWADTSVEYAGE